MNKLIRLWCALWLGMITTLPLPAQAQFADQRQWGGTSTGAANVQLVAVNNYNLNVGVVIRFVPGFANTGATTLSVNGGAAKAVQKRTPGGLVALVGGELTPGQLSEVLYDGSVFELFNPTVANSNGVHICVSKTTGNDSNTGLNGTCAATIARAASIAPRVDAGGGNVFIDLTDATPQIYSEDLFWNAPLRGAANSAPQPIIGSLWPSHLILNGQGGSAVDTVNGSGGYCNIVGSSGAGTEVAVENVILQGLHTSGAPCQGLLFAQYGGQIDIFGGVVLAGAFADLMHTENLGDIQIWQDYSITGGAGDLIAAGQDAVLIQSAGTGTFAANMGGASFTASIATGSPEIMTVSAVSSGHIIQGQTVGGSGVTASTVVLPYGTNGTTGVGLTGTYAVFQVVPQTVSSEAMTTVDFNEVMFVASGAQVQFNNATPFAGSPSGTQFIILGGGNITTYLTSTLPGTLLGIAHGTSRWLGAAPTTISSVTFGSGGSGSINSSSTPFGGSVILTAGTSAGTSASFVLTHAYTTDPGAILGLNNNGTATFSVGPVLECGNINSTNGRQACFIAADGTVTAGQSFGLTYMNISQ